MSTVTGSTRYYSTKKNNYVRNIECEHIVFSCSHDTTIKMWKLENEFLKDSGRDQHSKTLRSMHTLNDDSDYVKSIAYSSFANVLFSTADNGVVRKWDLSQGKSESNRKVALEENQVSQISI